MEDAVRSFKVREENMETHIRHGFTMAFYFLLRIDKGCNYLAALRTTIMQGGEAGTNASIVGAMIGAALGESAIPQDLKQKILSFDCTLEEKRPEYLSLKRQFPSLMEKMIGRWPDADMGIFK